MTKTEALLKIKAEDLAEQFKKDFPQAFVRPGYQFDNKYGCLLWTGGDWTLEDGFLAFDTYAEDYKETVYIMGVHRKVRDWADKHGIFFEAYDAETWMGYKLF